MCIKPKRIKEFVSIHDHHNFAILPFSVLKRAEFGTNYIETKYIFQAHRNYHEQVQVAPPSCNFILGWGQTVHNRSALEMQSQYKRSSMTSEDGRIVFSYFEIYPKTFLRITEHRLGFPRCQVLRIIRYILHLFSYKLFVVQKPEKSNYEARS